MNRSRALRLWLPAVAATFTLLVLAACGGGGGGGGGFGPGGQGISVKQPGLTAGGATAGISHNGTSPSITIRTPRGSIWTDTPAQVHTAPSGWFASTKSPFGDNSRIFHAVTDINSSTDNDYLAYGYWSRSVPHTLASSGFQSFYYGSMPYGGNAAAPSLQGMTATYTGGAAGVYNILGTSNYGHFKANFQLRANFGPVGTFVGSLTNITHLTGDPAFAFRNIDRVPGAISGSGFFGETILGGRMSGRFFGPSGALPTGVAGWFEDLRTPDNGSRTAILSGSFGATR